MTIPVRENLFVAFVNDRTSLHGLTRAPEVQAEWRFVYQCHLLPKVFDRLAIVERLTPEAKARWERGTTH